MALTTQATACHPRRESVGNDGAREALILENQPSHLLNASPGTMNSTPLHDGKQVNLAQEILNAIYEFAIDHTEPWKPALHLPDCPEECEVEGSQIASDGPEWGLAPSVELLENVKNPMQSGCGNSLRLTQVCQQIRAEYRPIWFRDACIPIRFELSESYFTTFFPKDSAVNYAPKLLQFSWVYGMSNSLLFGEMTYLLQLRASRETFRCAFFPEAFTEPRQFERCDYCSEEQLLQKHDMPDCYNTFDECVCPPWDVPYLEWRDFLVDQMSYTTIISRFVHNDNNAWLQGVREKKVSVHWYCTRMTNDITIKIIQKEPFKLSSSSSALDTARSLLKKWGMVSLEPSSKIDFLLVCEEKDVTIDDNVQMTTSLVRAVTVSRLPVPRAQNNSSVELLE